MPRGVRGSVDYNAQIQKLDEKIQRHTNALANLKSQRQELLVKKQETDMHDLYAYMQANHLSASEIIAQLSPSPVVAASSSPSTEKCV